MKLPVVRPERLERQKSPAALAALPGLLARLGGSLRGPVVSGLHRAAHGVFRAAGYRLELRRNGELKVGLWRKKLRAVPRGQLPRRLVFLPGFGDTPLSWWGVISTLQPVLRRSFDELVFVDFPGYCGALRSERCFHSMDLLLGAMSDILDALRPQTLVGHSLGGWIAAHYAALCGEGQRPRDNRKTYTGPEVLVLADAAGVYGSPEARAEYKRTYEEIWEHGFEKMRPHVFAREPAWFRWLLPEFVEFIERSDVNQFMRSVREDHLLEDRIDRIKARTWLFWGEHDTLTPPSAIETWQRSLPGAHAILIRGAGHSPQLERPAITALLLAQVLGLEHGEKARWLDHPRAGKWWVKR